MEELIAKVEAILNSHFPGEDNIVDLTETVPGQKIGGSFTTGNFRGMSIINRQTVMRRTLREHLSLEQAWNVGVILTLTPQEVAAMDEVAVAV